MDAAKNTIHFWSKNIWSAARFALSFGEIRGETINIIKGVFFNLLAYLGIGALSAQPIDFKRALYWLVLLFVARFILGLLYFPAKFYTEIKREANKYTFKDIEIQPYRFPEGSGYGVGVSLLSNKYDDQHGSIIDVIVKVGSVRHGHVEMLDRELQCKTTLPLLVASGSHFEPTTYILHKRHRNEWFQVSAVPIASWDNNKAWLVDTDGKGIILELEKHRTYRVTISIDAKLDNDASGLPMQGCGIWCDLLWKDKSGITITKFMRNPLYEF